MEWRLDATAVGSSFFRLHFFFGFPTVGRLRRDETELGGSSFCKKISDVIVFLLLCLHGDYDCWGLCMRKTRKG